MLRRQRAAQKLLGRKIWNQKHSGLPYRCERAHSTARSLPAGSCSTVSVVMENIRNHVRISCGARKGRDASNLTICERRSFKRCPYGTLQSISLHALCCRKTREDGLFHNYYCPFEPSLVCSFRQSRAKPCLPQIVGQG